VAQILRERTAHIVSPFLELFSSKRIEPSRKVWNTIEAYTGFILNEQLVHVRSQVESEEEVNKGLAQWTSLCSLVVFLSMVLIIPFKFHKGRAHEGGGREKYGKTHPYGGAQNAKGIIQLVATKGERHGADIPN
jgi:hypothetical protein